MSPVIDVCCERGVGTADVEGGRSFEAGERGAFLCQRCGYSKLGGLVPPLSSRDGQGKDFRECGVSGDPQRSVTSVDLPQEPGTAAHCLTDVDRSEEHTSE